MQLLKEWREGILPPVFFTAAALSVAFILFAGIWSQTAAVLFGNALSAITQHFDWLYIAITASTGRLCGLAAVQSLRQFAAWQAG